MQSLLHKKTLKLPYSYGQKKNKIKDHTVTEELLKSFGQISSTSHFPNQTLVHKQGEETDHNAAN